MIDHLTDILRARRVDFALGGEHHHVRVGWVGVDCPWCGPFSGQYHLGINGRTGYARCWRCGPHRLSDVLARLTRAEPRTVRGWMDAMPRRGGIIPQEARTGVYTRPAGVGPMLPAHLAYLRRRGLDGGEVARLWGVAGIGIAARLRWRLFIPVTLDGQAVSWTTRAIGDAEQRYISAREDEEALPAKRLLYGADLARNAVIAVEGPVDAWAVGPGAVATLGQDVTDAQLALLSAFAVRVVCFDATPDAQRRADVLVDALAPFPGRTVRVELETGKDAAEADRREVAELRREFLGE